VEDRARSEAGQGDPIPIGEPDADGALPGERARQLLGVLGDQDCDAAIYYQGVLRVLPDAANPVALKMAAYGLRELMEELEAAAGVTSKSKDRGLTERVRDLSEEWESAGRPVDGAADPDRAEILLAFDRFLIDFDESDKRRRERAKVAIAALDPARREEPPEVQDARADAWMGFRDRFNKVLHHGSKVTEADFRADLDSFESFLMRWLRPRTFADFDALDELLEKGPLDD
jgi:hypothetical protein